MQDVQTPRHRQYLVTLKSGDIGIFTNTHDVARYENLLMSGMYGIMPRGGGSNILITPESVQSIIEIADEARENKKDAPGKVSNGDDER
jgi:hypothetical protein